MPIAEGVTRDKKEAVRWFKKAAEQGDAKAQNNIGLIYANGYSVTKDNEKAVRWFKKAARQGNKDAIKSLKILGMTN